MGLNEMLLRAQSCKMISDMKVKPIIDYFKVPDNIYRMSL